MFYAPENRTAHEKMTIAAINAKFEKNPSDIINLAVEYGKVIGENRIDLDQKMVSKAVRHRFKKMMPKTKFKVTSDLWYGTRVSTDERIDYETQTKLLGEFHQNYEGRYLEELAPFSRREGSEIKKDGVIISFKPVLNW